MHTADDTVSYTTNNDSRPPWPCEQMQGAWWFATANNDDYRQHTTRIQPLERLLVGWIVGGTLTVTTTSASISLQSEWGEAVAQTKPTPDLPQGRRRN